MSDIKEDVIGRWGAVLERLGVDVGDGRHTACPICNQPGKSKPFRFDDIDGTGSWICNYCGAGDGWSLLMKKFNFTFPQAVDEVVKIIGTCEKKKVSPESKVSPTILRHMFINSEPIKKGDIAWFYLRKRGLLKIPPALRFSYGCWEPETRKHQNAMLAIFSGADGQAITIHRTFLNEDGLKLEIEEPRKIMPALKKMSGGAVRLWPVSEVIGIAEGIETAAAASQLFGIPVWSALTAQLLEAFEPPKEVKMLCIFSDNDINFTGQAAAYSLGKRLSIRGGIKVKIMIPETPGEDWLDQLIKENRK